jgi:hypothetical protein
MRQQSVFFLERYDGDVGSWPVNVEAGHPMPTDGVIEGYASREDAEAAITALLTGRDEVAVREVRIL